MKINASRRSGFTLIELSIVLIIIGLIIGAVLAGQELIKSAEVRGIISQLDRYTTATNAFRLKYNSLPGDFQYASTLLPIVGAVTGINGDGNGLIYTGAPTAPLKWDNEMFYFWQHLGLLGVVENVFAGTATPTVGTYIPSLKNNRGGLIAYTSTDGSNYYHLGIANSTTAITSGTTTFSGSDNINTPFAPDGAYNIDNKIDDSSPTTGKVIAVITFDTVVSSYSATVCASSAAAYNILNNPGYVCTLRYKALF